MTFALVLCRRMWGKVGLVEQSPANGRAKRTVPLRPINSAKSFKLILAVAD